jgi:hypothetical protein
LAAFGPKDARVAQLDLEGTLFRAALLCGYGAEAGPLAARMASACQGSGGRSCVDAGAPLQMTVEAPGETELRVGLRLGKNLEEARLRILLSDDRAAGFLDAYSRLASADHASLGFWMFWSRHRQSVFADLRDPEPASAVKRVRPVLDPPEQARLDAILSFAPGGRPWGVSLELDRDHARRTYLYWFMSRPREASACVESFCPGGWQQVVEVLGHLLTLPGQSGRWLVGIPLAPSGEWDRLWVGNSAWGLVPENDQKHRAVGSLMTRFGGPRDYAEALWSLCRGSAELNWRVGRTCEVGLGSGDPRVRLLLTPQVLGATAGINNSASFDSSIGPVETAPLGA